ncbi:MAG: GDYXXLXY domain-containing protein [Solirubrobacterales bacterium]
MSKRIFIIIVCLQVLLLTGMILDNQYILRYGQPILLKTEPIDPNSLFSGEYVDLNYEISDLDLDQTVYEVPPAGMALEAYYAQGKTVYVTLKKNGRFYEAARIARHRTEPGAGQIVLKGRIRWSEPIVAVRVSYGIESYYTPEGKAKGYERPTNGTPVVTVRVDRFGRGRIEKVVIDPTIKPVIPEWMRREKVEPK